MISVLGTFLDPMADKVCVMSMYGYVYVDIPLYLYIYYTWDRIMVYHNISMIVFLVLN